MTSEYGRDSTFRRLVGTAEAQHGVFTRRQAIEQGVTSSMIQRRLVTGTWERVHQGVYRFTGTPVSWPQLLIAACLAWGKGAVVSHRAAAALWRYPGFEPGIVELIAPNTRRLRLDGVIVHRLSSISRADVTSIDGIPVTSAARTLIDIAAHASRDVCEEALDDGLRRRIVSVRWLRWRLAQLEGRRGTKLIRSLLDEYRPSSPVADSNLEKKWLRALRAEGLRPVLHYQVRAGDRLIVPDLAFPLERVAVEVDGYEWHSGKRRWRRDLARRNLLAALGWKTFHLTDDDLKMRRAAVIEEIRAALAPDPEPDRTHRRNRAAAGSRRRKGGSAPSSSRRAPGD